MLPGLFRFLFVIVVPAMLLQSAVMNESEEKSQPTSASPPYVPPSYMVTPQELRHHVPKAARSEMDKAEKARRSHKPQEEIDHLTKAVALDPEYTWARNNLAACLVRTDADTAAAQLEAAIRLDPHQPILFHNLAIAELYAHRLGPAEAAARQARDLGSADIRTRVLLAWILVRGGQYTDEALSLVKSGAKEFPVVWIIAARVLYAQGHLSEARRNVQNYLASNETQMRSMAENWLREISAADQRLTNQAESADWTSDFAY